MKLTTHDRQLRLSDKPPRREVTSRTKDAVRRYAPTGIKQFPGRKVSYMTAYKRLQRFPEMSLEEACTTPSIQPRSKKLPRRKVNYTMRQQMPAAYIEELEGTDTALVIAERWDTHVHTVRRHRNLLRGEDNEANRV